MTFAVTPLSGPLGAEISGLDAGSPIDNSTAADLRRALHVHQVLTIRDQRLTPRQFVDFARAFGKIEPFFINAYSLPEAPEIYVLSNARREGKPIGRDGAGTHWHSDHTFHREPASATILYALEVPAAGGDTLFVDMYRACEELPEDLKRQLEGRKAIHRYQKKEHIYSAETDADAVKRARIGALQALRRQEEAGQAPTPTARHANTLPDQLHPILRTHPATGRKALYLNDEMTVGIDGMPEAEGRALLKALCARATAPDRVFTYKWRAGDIVIWDNPSVMHAATYTDPGEARTLYRLTVKGSEPF
jgi:taurine dioxygenase